MKVTDMKIYKIRNSFIKYSIIYISCLSYLYLLSFSHSLGPQTNTQQKQVLILLCSDKHITETLCERSRRKSRNRTECITFRRNVLKAEAFAALSTENKFDPDDSSTYLRLGLLSESSRYAVELLELLREIRMSSSTYDLSTLMNVLRKSLFSFESRLRRGPRLVEQLELIR